MNDVDVEATEAVEAQLNAFISKRAEKGGEQRRVEEAWAESVRRHHARRRELNRQRWIEYFGNMHRLHLGIAEEHADRRSRLLAEDYGPDDPPEAA